MLAKSNTFVNITAAIMAFSVGVFIFIFSKFERDYISSFVLIAILFSITSLFTLPIAYEKIKRLFKNIKIPHLLLVSLFCSVFIWRIRSNIQLVENPIDKAAIPRLALVLIPAIIALSVLMSSKRAIWHLSHGLICAMALYGVIAIFSALYSSYPGYSLWKAFELLVDIFIIAILLSYRDTFENMRKLYNLTLFLLSLLLLSIWLGAIFAPSLAFRPSKGLFSFILVGAFPIMSANAVGTIGAIIGTISLSRLINIEKFSEKLLYFTLLLISIITIILAQSRAALIAFPIGMAIILFCNKKIRFFIFIIALITIFALNTTILNFMETYFLRGQSKHMFMSLSGRTSFWQHTWEKFKESPVFGYGFAAGARYDVLGELGHETTVGLHGGIFDILANLGILGLIPWSIAFFGACFILLKFFYQYKRRIIDKWKTLFIELIAIMVIFIVKISFTTFLIMHGQCFLLLLSIISVAELLRYNNLITLKNLNILN